MSHRPSPPPGNSRITLKKCMQTPWRGWGNFTRNDDEVHKIIFETNKYPEIDWKSTNRSSEISTYCLKLGNWQRWSLCKGVIDKHPTECTEQYIPFIQRLLEFSFSPTNRDRPFQSPVEKDMIPFLQIKLNFISKIKFFQIWAIRQRESLWTADKFSKIFRKIKL